MNKTRRVLSAIAVLLALLSAVGCSKLRARDQLNKGVNSYKNARYEEAIEHFKNAVALDPKLINAQLYLATAYMQQYIPGADSPDNNRYAQQAIDEFKSVLETNPPKEQKLLALKGIASLYFNMKKMDDAKDYQLKVAALDPNDPETYYSVGVIDWTQTYQPRMEERAKLGLKPTDDPKGKDCTELLKVIKDKNEPKVQDGITNLQKALQLRPDYDDAMAYLNLMYREEADLQCDNPDARKTDLKTADEWVDKNLATKKAKAEKAGPSGLVTTETPANQ
jgi:tetratricopeptide (TPR) repeat protein